MSIGGKWPGGERTVEHIFGGVRKEREIEMENLSCGSSWVSSYAGITFRIRLPALLLI